jgi:septal ring factor EnvC (AmiA/AmiB activator)
MMISAADSFMPSAQQFGIMAVLLAAVVASYLYSRHRRRPTDGTPKQYRRELDSAAAQGRTVQRDMEQLLTELERLAARLNEQLDAKHQDLQQSLAEADKRISALRILLDEAKRRLDRGPLATTPARESGPADTFRDEVESPSVARDQRPAPDRRRRIYQLADEGLTPLQIAVQLGQPVGEVELILNLRVAQPPSVVM